MKSPCARKAKISVRWPEGTFQKVSFEEHAAGSEGARQAVNRERLALIRQGTRDGSVLPTGKG